MKTMTSGLRVLLVLLALSLFSAAVTGAEIYFRATYLWVVFLAFNWVWARLSLWGLRVHRQARVQRAEMGQVFEERFTLQNPRGMRRLWVEVRDDSPLPGASGSQVFSNVGKFEERSYISRVRLLQRGVFPLGPTVLASSDLFGIFPVEQAYAPSQHLTVYPLMVHLRAFPEPAGMLPGGEALRRRTLQTTPNAAGVREYAPGDPLNRIHWPTTARRERLMVKEFELDPQAEVWLFLDGEAAVHARQPWEAHFDPRDLWVAHEKTPLPPDTAEYAASIAASLTRYYLEQRRSVGLVSHGREALVLPAEQGSRQLLKVLDTLALWQPQGTLPLAGMVEAQATHLPRGSTAVLITPSPRMDVALAVGYLQARGLRPVVVLLQADTFGGAQGSDMLARRLAGMQVSVRQVACGDDLQRALEYH
ncbi:MAG: DUF58 domain-containing protein [Anaerolineae bacterium]|nr:MAG: DUF58 domain-containing protein [Anaerolineae bacterium]